MQGRSSRRNVSLLTSLDAKDPIEVPAPAVAVDTPQGFLFEWWTIFWDLYNAKGLKGGSPAAQNYVQNSMRLRQEQARQALQQAQAQPQLPNQLHQNHQLPHQLTSQQIQQPGLVQQHNNGLSIMGPNGPLVNYAGFLNMNPQHAMMQGNLMQNPMAAGQLPENMSEADKRNFAARQALLRRGTMTMPANPAQMQQFQQQFFQQQQQQQQQRQAALQAQAQGAAQQNTQQKQPPQPHPQQPQQPPQIRHPMNPNGHPRPQGQTPQPNPQPQTSNHASPVPHQGHLGHRNSTPMVEDGAIPSHSPTPQTNSPSKRQRLSEEGSYVATAPHINGGAMPQNMPNQPVMINPNGQFGTQFNPAMLQVKGVNGVQQFPQGMTPQQRQNLMAMGPGKMPGQAVVTPGGTQIPGSSPMAMSNDLTQNGMMEYNRPQQSAQRLPQNVNALQDYQNQLMLLERVNQQRLSEGGSNNGAQNPPQRSLSSASNAGQFPKQGAPGRPAASASPALANADIQRRGTPQMAKQQPPVSPLTDIHGQPPHMQGPQRASPNVANNGFNGNMIPGPNGTMVNGQPAAGGPQGMWPGQAQAQSPHIQQRRSPSQPMGQNQPAHSPAAPLNHPSPAAAMMQPNQMPPPTAPISSIGNKTQPSSPNLGNPPTPTQGHKQVAKGKKEAPNAAKKRGKKGNPATPIGTSEPPTPTTPATPHTAAMNGGPSTATAKPGDAKDDKPAPSEKPDEHMNDAVMFNAQRQGVPVSGAGMGAMNTGGLDVTAGGPAGFNGGFLEGNFLEDFGGAEGDMDFDFNTFINEDGTSNGLAFDSNSAFNWTEGVETGNDV